MNLTNEKIGQRIKAVRTEKNITQTQLAKFLGKSLRTVQSYESGESRIFFDTICSIANFLGGNSLLSLGVCGAPTAAELPVRRYRNALRAQQKERAAF